MKKLVLIFTIFVFASVSLKAGDNPNGNNGTDGNDILRKVFFECLTNASCGPCAANDPFLKAFINSKGDSIITVKYHGSFPGFDPMYNANTTQNQERYATYYGMNASPWLNVGGKVHNDVWPWNTPTLMENAYRDRVNTLTPVQISVTDTRVTGDSIKADITVNNLSSLPAGDYKLRVFAVERVVEYTTPPGSNGVTKFEYVFRRAYPNTAGTTVATGTGAQNFTFTYLREASWVDSNTYTIAFVQNDAPANKEVMNVASGFDIPTGITPVSGNVPEKFSLSQNYPNPFNPSTNIRFAIPGNTQVKLAVYNSLGQEVATLVNENIAAGEYDFQWNGVGFSSGVYYYRLETEGFSEIRKMMLIK